MTASVRAPDRAAISGVRRAARAGYRWLLLAFLLGVAAQIFLAGLGTFSFDTGRPASGALSAHQHLGFSLAAAMVVQTVVLQGLLDGLADNTVAFGGLHALDGFLIAANAAVQYALARRRAPQDAS